MDTARSTHPCRDKIAYNRPDPREVSARRPTAGKKSSTDRSRSAFDHDQYLNSGSCETNGNIATA